ncbi:hypothetical protein QBC32DRAFT_372049 [Pseudoneurospora amorphoporcata]|uniref:Ankyrin n=1 Tax=Pseudoneurospora amorphoporcata TaxID=241081 RepID=A0AAN6SE58_9PEZI|nr:hypothetical protein QBC32DRAFT_372049 [Pseudoneurospora amorphoporcata]
MSSSAEQSLTLPSEAQQLTLLDLADDVVRMIVDHLTDSELNRLARACKASYTICNWELYKRDSQSLNPQALLAPWTALHFAAVFNQVEATKFLLQNGADVTVVCPRDGYFVLKDDDPLPCPPLFTALKTKSEDVAEVLLLHGASPLWAPPGTGRHAKETALVIAARLGMWKLLELIVCAGVDVNAGCHVDDVPRWSTDPAGQSILRRLCYHPGYNSRTRKPTEEVISELVRLGARATVREVPGRHSMVHLVLQLIVGYRQGKTIKSDWPLASVLLRTGACDGTMEDVEVLAAIQLALFPKNCPYTPNLTRHTLPDLTFYNRKCRDYSIKACFLGTRCKCKLGHDRYPENDPANGRKWQAELLQELVKFYVRHYGWRGLHAALPFLTETLMPDDHKTRVTNVRYQTALHIALNIESFDEKLWYVDGKPTKDVDRAFDQQHDALFYLLQRCTSEELLALDIENCTPLHFLLDALYWDEDDEYYKAHGTDPAGPRKKPRKPFPDYVWTRKCLAFVERMLTEIPEMSDYIHWRVIEELHWRRWELSCEEGLIYLGRTGGRGRMPHHFPSFAPQDGEMKRPIPQNPPLPTRPAKHALPSEPAPPPPAKRQQTTELQATRENTTTDHPVANQQHVPALTSVSVGEIDFDALMENIQEEADLAWSNRGV